MEGMGEKLDIFLFLFCIDKAPWSFELLLCKVELISGFLYELPSEDQSPLVRLGAGAAVFFLI